ncbi:hypothetical protein CI109_107122 [Kwoniella shandongensis]|uniref:Uncharacterized protein n=1 Tax=Kwoniella shandongensis TaxID=1734106 RepID=A0A5M6C216_9TREE|nr:uncharacterized protein CI109_002405 [Kwoniella shandongensis]KAA5529064.1 hypothetical protein CI109_002405 [Kwoniella shandongensis]
MTDISHHTIPGTYTLALETVPDPTALLEISTHTEELDNDDSAWESSSETDHHPTAMDASSSTASMRTPKKTPKSTASGRASPSTASATSSSKRPISSPRRRDPARRRVVIPTSPPRTANTTVKTGQTQNVAPRPALVNTLNILLTPLQLLILPLQTLFSPFLSHLANALVLISIFSAAVYFLLPLLPSLIFKILGKSLRFLSNDFISRTFNNLPGDGDITIGTEFLLLPVRTLATPACALAGVGCQLSLLSSGLVGNGTTVKARPFWRWASEKKGDEVDVGQVARALTKEVRGARDIFDSVRMLGEGGLANGLEYVRVWELGVAVLTGSNLEDKAIVGQQLIELGDLTRDLSDEIVNIDSMSVNAFSWMQWEFSRLVQLLSLPPASRPSPETLSRKLHSLLLRLSSTLDTLHHLTSTSVQHASRASSHGSTLLMHLHTTRHELEQERDRSPIWKRVIDKSTHLVVGGEPTKTELIQRDLNLARDTITNLGDLRWRLEDTRVKVKTFRDQIGMFDASMMGFHLGQQLSGDEDDGLGPEEEVRILSSVVEELGKAVGRAKEGKPVEREMLEIGPGEE